MSRYCLLFALLVLGVTYSNAGYGDPPAAYPGYPNWHERSLIVLTNACRFDPVGYRNAYVGAAYTTILQPSVYPAVGPVYWNIDLNRSSRAHATDMASKCGLQHNSCNGTDAFVRINSYYTQSGNLAENIASGNSSPLATMKQWVMDGNPPAADGSGTDGHRKNIMSSAYHELGAGYDSGKVQYSYFWVHDFGGGSSPYAPFPIIAGSHFFIDANKTTFMAAYFDASGKAPQQALVVINGVSLPLTRTLGKSASGSYQVLTDKFTLCRTYYFSFIDGAGKAWRYPQVGSFSTILEGSCAYDYISAAAIQQGKKVDRRAVLSKRVLYNNTKNIVVVSRTDLFNNTQFYTPGGKLLHRLEIEKPVTP